jgi:FdhD protein
MADPTVVREPARAPGVAVDLLRAGPSGVTVVTDTLVVEEPLEIHVNGWRWLVTMRTPGDDADLVVGLLASEGVIERATEVERLLFTRHPDEPDLANVVDARLVRPLGEIQARLARNQVLATSSCGLCGASAIEAVRTRGGTIGAGPTVDAALLARMPRALAAAQPLFQATGGLHAAALFSAAGELLAAREDVGRHNATDKILGWRLRAADEGAPAAILLVSGRASFEIVQKAWVAGIPIVAAVSAPSSLAVDLAREAGMTLAGFVRGESLNVYAGRERLTDLDDQGWTPPAAAPAAEADPTLAAALELIPRAMRATLDAVALKISLADWQALTLGERLRLVVQVAEGHAEEFAASLTERVTARTGRAPRPLTPRAPKGGVR